MSQTDSYLMTFSRGVYVSTVMYSSVAVKSSNKLLSVV